MPLRDIRGHRRLTELLARSIERGTLPPASIFAGPASDKSAVAIAVAQALNCLQPTGGDACGTCKACKRIERRNHPDVLAVVPNDKGNIGIDDVRAGICIGNVMTHSERPTVPGNVLFGEIHVALVEHVFGCRTQQPFGA